jgi:outer membrane protein assembly factor BamB
MQTKGRFDPNSPAIKAYEQELAHQFVREGTMVAFPMCMPGMTKRITHDECRITALDIDSDGQIYGGTSGRQAHLFSAALHDLTGVVLDAGVVADGTSTVAVCCGKSRALAFVNGARGGRAIAIPKIDLAQDWIQEWGLNPPVLQDLGECVSGEPVVHAICDASRSTVIGISSGHLFTMDAESGKVTVIGEVPGRGHLARSSTGVFGQDDGARLWQFDPASGKFRRAAVDLPKGDWSGPLRWARSGDADGLFIADNSGQLFSFDGGKGFQLRGKTPLAPIGPMAVTSDGRLFGFCGAEIANLFCCDMTSGTVSNLGVAASVFERRRYGYQFADAVIGRDGEVVFGEDDNDGHLWLYFPRVRSVPRKPA